MMNLVPTPRGKKSFSQLKLEKFHEQLKNRKKVSVMSATQRQVFNSTFRDLDSMVVPDIVKELETGDVSAQT